MGELSDLELRKACAEALGWKHLGAVGVDLEAEGVTSPSEADRLFTGKLWCLSGGNDWWRHPEGHTVCGRCESIPDPLHDDAQAMALVKRFNLSVAPAFGAAPGRVIYWDVYTPWQDEGGVKTSLSHRSALYDDNLNRAICECVARMKGATEKGAE